MKVKHTSSKWFLENNGEWIKIDEKWTEKIKTLVYKKLNSHKKWQYVSYVDYVNWQPAPDTEYQLSDDVEFEIIKICQCEIEGCRSCMCPKVAHLKVEKKELQEIKYGENSAYPSAESIRAGAIQALKKSWSEKTKIDNPFDKIHDAAREWAKLSESVSIATSGFLAGAVWMHSQLNKIVEKQEQSEVERLSEYYKKDILDRDNSITNLKQRLGKVSQLEDRVRFLEGLKGDVKYKQFKRGIEDLKKIVSEKDSRIKELESKLSQLSSNGLIAHIKEKQKEYTEGSAAYNVLRELEVTIPSMFGQLPKEEEHG